MRLGVRLRLVILLLAHSHTPDVFIPTGDRIYEAQ
jgi:hypothetical protein